MTSHLQTRQAYLHWQDCVAPGQKNPDIVTLKYRLTLNYRDSYTEIQCVTLKYSYSFTMTLARISFQLLAPACISYTILYILGY